MSGSHTAADGGERDPLVGTTLGGRYAIKRVIGWGGMGVVYLALDTQERERKVVVKVLARQLLHDSSAQQRFDREASSLKTLRHPNIVELYAFDRDGDRGYIVMEYLDGVLLSKYLSDNGSMPIEDFVPIAAQVLKGAGYAHSREVVLRDIKPDNMMLCERKGRANFVKMLDFGLAKLLNDQKQITKEEVIGTIGYIAPEVISGKSADLRADVYALGVMFYRMLAGQLPFPAEDQSQAALLYKTVNAEVPPLGDLVAQEHDVPAAVIDLVHDCLRKDPNERPADANVLVERLIDAVPASLFRLPHSAVHSGTFAARLARRARPASDLLAESSIRAPILGSTGETEPPPSSEQLAAPTDSAEDEPQESSGGRGLWIGLAAVVLLGAGVAVGLAVSGDDNETGTPPAKTVAKQVPADPPAADPPPSSTAGAEVAKNPTPAAQEVAEPAPEPAATKGPLRVTSTPEGASVLLDDERVGTTPFEGTAPLGSHTLIVRADGHEDWTQTVVVTDDEDESASVVAKLEATKAPSSGRRRTGRRGRRDSDTPPAPQPTTAEPDKPTPVLPSGEKKSKRSDALLSETGGGKKSSVLLPGSK